jgi:hypothetical protein
MRNLDGGRRRFLKMLVTSLVAPFGLRATRAWPDATSRHAPFIVDAGLLYGVVNLHLDGTLDESIDRAAGTYAVTLGGDGVGMTVRIESRGVLQQRRWTPLEAHSTFTVRGRPTRSDITYDWARRTVAYHYRGETFFLRRLRVADDVVSVPPGVHVDDAVSAMLNYADDRWTPQADGTYQTQIVRRKKPENEGPDDVRGVYRAELAPLTLKLTSDPKSGKPTALFDLSRFSSWAKPDEPARITFGPDRRPETLALDMIYGTSVKVELRSVELRRASGLR